MKDKEGVSLCGGVPMPTYSLFLVVIDDDCDDDDDVDDDGSWRYIDLESTFTNLFWSSSFLGIVVDFGKSFSKSLGIITLTCVYLTRTKNFATHCF